MSISVLVCAGPVCEMDEMFLESAHQLLRIILETNAQTGKHMLLCESGEHILSLFEVLYLVRHYKTGHSVQKGNQILQQIFHFSIVIYNSVSECYIIKK